MRFPRISVMRSRENSMDWQKGDGTKPPPFLCVILVEVGDASYTLRGFFAATVTFIKVRRRNLM